MMPGAEVAGSKADQNIDFLAVLLSASGVASEIVPDVPLYPEKCCDLINDGQKGTANLFAGPGSNSPLSGMDNTVADLMLPQTNNSSWAGNKVDLSFYQLPVIDPGLNAKETGNAVPFAAGKSSPQNINKIMAAGMETVIIPALQEGEQPQQLPGAGKDIPAPGNIQNAPEKITPGAWSMGKPGIQAGRVAEIIGRAMVVVNNPAGLNAAQTPGLSASQEGSPGIHMEPVIEVLEQKITGNNAIPVINRPGAIKSNILAPQTPAVQSEQLAQVVKEAKPTVYPAIIHRDAPKTITGVLAAGPKEDGAYGFRQLYPNQNPSHNEAAGESAREQRVEPGADTAQTAQDNSYKVPGPGARKIQQIIADVNIDGGKTAGAAEPSLASGQQKTAYSGADPVPVKHMPQLTAGAALKMIDWSKKNNSPAMNVIRLKLEPRHLGEMTVRLAYNKGELTAHFYTSSVMARDAVEGTLPQLREVLSQQNIQLGDAAAFVGRDNTHQQGQGGGYRHSGGSLRGDFAPGDSSLSPDELLRNKGVYNEGLNLLV